MRVQTEPDFSTNWKIYLQGILTTDTVVKVSTILRYRGIDYPTIADFKEIYEEDLMQGKRIGFTSLKSYMMFKQMINKA